MSDLAKRLLAENKATKNRFLSLGQCGLAQIPIEVGDPHRLEFLSLGARWVEWDPEGWHRGGSPSDETTFTDLGPLARLSHLRHLYLSEAGAANLRSQSGLLELQTLDVSNTQVGTLVPWPGSVVLRSGTHSTGNPTFPVHLARFRSEFKSTVRLSRK